ncbi:hypothetical protein NPIL_65301 [Nephila pilipes]|uniref:Uncharacterized protein n=1 Tax=Nephila pilipes TaxID=299642 RepID=A0A8X6Q213_NEPPI|nr:hypothetical protein NPIL_65301 [Nephila pilipes]
MDPVQMESGESVSGCFQSMSLEQLKIAVDSVDNSDNAWAMLSQVEDLIMTLPQYEYNSPDHQSNIELQVLDLRTAARYQVQYFARKECEAKMIELNELRQDWDPHAAMNLDDGFQVVRRGKHRFPRHNSDDSNTKKQKKVLLDTSNQFTGLSIEEPPDFLVEPTSTSTVATRAAAKPNVASNHPTSTRKERPVPPITIDNIPRKDLLIKQLRDLTSGRITARVQGTGIKVFPQTTQAYQQRFADQVSTSADWLSLGVPRPPFHFRFRLPIGNGSGTEFFRDSFFSLLALFRVRLGLQSSLPHVGIAPYPPFPLRFSLPGTRYLFSGRSASFLGDFFAPR